MLIGIEFADRLVPKAWRSAGGSSAALSTTYTNADGRGVLISCVLECEDESRGGVAIRSRVQVGQLQKYIDQSAFVPSRTKAQSEADWMAQATKVAARHPGLIPLLPEALASPEKSVWAEYPERAVAAQLMELRSGLRLFGDLWCCWAAVLPVWLLVLGIRWQEVLWPRRTNSCAKCGYDRTGLVKGTVCPECGTRP